MEAAALPGWWYCGFVSKRLTQRDRERYAAAYERRKTSWWQRAHTKHSELFRPQDGRSGPRIPLYSPGSAACVKGIWRSIRLRSSTRRTPVQAERRHHHPSSVIPKQASSQKKIVPKKKFAHRVFFFFLCCCCSFLGQPIGCGGRKTRVAKQATASETGKS